ncbi:MAG: hypothetical protein D6766_09300, partial [Verrucomicrobia bacterium]
MSAEAGRSNVRGLAWMFGGRGLLTVSQVAAIMVLARLLNREEFGAATAVLLLAQLSCWVATCGLGPALVQRPEIEPRHVSTALVVAMGGGLATGVVLVAARPLLAWFFNLGEYQGLLFWLVALCPLAALQQVTYSLMQRAQRFQWISVTETLSFAGGYTALSIVLALAGAGPLALVLGQMATYAGMVTSYWIGLRPPFPGRPGSRAFRELARTGLGFGLAELVGWSAQNVDKFLVGRLLGLSALGVYSRAFAVLQSLTNLLTYPLDSVLFPAFSRVQDQPERLRSLFIRSNLLVIVLCLPPAILLVLAPEAVVLVLLGAEWIEAAPVLRVFGAFLLFRVNYRVTDFVLRARGMVYQRFWIIVAFCVLAAALTAVGSMWGLTGVAFGMSGCFLFTFLALAWLALPQVRLGWGDYLALFAAPVLLGAVVVAAGWWPVAEGMAGWPALVRAVVVGLGSLGLTAA